MPKTAVTSINEGLPTLISCSQTQRYISFRASIFTPTCTSNLEEN